MLTLNQLPTDIITDILSRFPAKTVVSLKIVCKLWCNLINDDEFVHVHVKQSLATKTNLHFIVSPSKLYLRNCFYPSTEIRPLLYSADFDSFDNPIDLSHPFKNYKTQVGVIGSCRGLLLLRVDDGHLLLYNPTTQTYNKLPLLPEEPCDRPVFGFGYDIFSKDWKCVRIMQVVYQCEVMVYSFKGNSWKKLVDVPRFSEPGNWGIGALVHEMIHWVGTNTNIVTFSLRDETFTSLPLPSFEVKSDDYLYVGDLDGCLCVLANCYLECNVWIMKEYGVAESWTRMFRYEKHRWESLTRPVSFSMEKEKLFVLTSLQKLVYIDLQSTELTEVMLTNCDNGLGVNVYAENILQLDCPERIRITKKPGKGKNKKKNRRNNY
ncbi:F-box protein CPR1-like [Silene latifolia]|uniref:F-box protein CPR1-like n=1 Tax=Silene latifolia TaxID=37657 RepID=UPI003D76F3B7